MVPRNTFDNMSRKELINHIKTLTEITPDGILTHEKGVILDVDQAFTKIMGYEPSEIVGKSLYDTVFKGNREIIEKQLITLEERTFEISGIHKNGSKVYLEVTARNYSHNGRKARVVCFRDITEQKKRQNEIEFLAYHDELTGLPNRTLFNRRLSLAMTRSQLKNQNVAILLLDLDGFKNINDTLTHNIGDKLIQVVSTRLKECVYEENTIARFGGDEFQILLHNTTKQNSSEIAEHIITAFNEPFKVEDYQLHISVSIGISIYPKDGENTEQLIKNADIAMYESKQMGKNQYTFYKRSMSQNAFHHLTLENELRSSLKNNELLLHYQPQINLNNNEIFGVEALIRWHHAEFGLVNPGEFIPIAERTGMILEIGDWVTYTACLQAKLWQEKGYKPLTVSVNISAKQFHNPDLVNNIKKILNETKLSPQYLDIEITEDIAMENQDYAIDKLIELKELGIGIHIDDFGTGYSSFNYLKKFPISKVKIDKSFIMDIPKRKDDESITKAITAMAKSMDLAVIAEGVETKQQIDFLTQIGCNEIQGFYFSKPLPSKEFESLLKSEYMDKNE